MEPEPRPLLVAADRALDGRKALVLQESSQKVVSRLVRMTMDCDAGTGQRIAEDVPVRFRG